MATVVDFVRAHAGAMPSRLALGDVESGRRWTWAELDRDADRLAAWLVDALGKRSGVRVAILGRNDPRQIVVHFACLRAGAIHVPLNWRLSPNELTPILEDCSPEILFVDEEFDAVADGFRRFCVDDIDKLGIDGTKPPLSAMVGWDSPLSLLYTSGTTGSPKGVIVTAANAFWGNLNYMLGSGLARDSVMLCDMPLFHTAGLFGAARSVLLAGGCVWISRGFDPQQTIARISDPCLGINHYFSVPQMAATIWNHPSFDPARLANLRLWSTGGAPNPPAQVRRFVDVGIPLSDGFGMSETASNFGMPVDNLQLVAEKAGSCGLPFASIEVRIVNADGTEMPTGEAGELLLRGPSVTPGYWNRPDLTAGAFSEAWFHTGDIARCDKDGFFFIVDRRKDMYISGGENVYPAEVEAALAALPEILEAAVVGVPDERWGEVGHAFVVMRGGHSLACEDIIAHCRTRLAGFKVPARVSIVDSLPRTASGKVQKHLLQG